jgi:hypothetical protein
MSTGDIVQGLLIAASRFAPSTRGILNGYT